MGSGGDGKDLVQVTPEHALATAHRILRRAVDGSPAEVLTVEGAMAVKAALFDAHREVARLRAELNHAKRRAAVAGMREAQLVDQVVAEERRALAAETKIAKVASMLSAMPLEPEGWRIAALNVLEAGE